MPTPPVLVGPSGLAIASGGLPQGGALLVAPSTNTDTVWVDPTPLQAAGGIPITPGSAQPWPANLPLYAWSPSAAQQLGVGADVPIGTNAGAVAAQLIAQGLTPAAIAQQINIAGVPAIDQPALLYSNTQAVSAGQVPSWATGGSGPLSIDMTKWQSFTLTLFINEAAYTGIAVVDFDEVWTDTAGQTVSIRGARVAEANGRLKHIGGARAATLTLSMSALTNAATVTLSITGSLRQIPDDVIKLDTATDPASVALSPLTEVQANNYLSQLLWQANAAAGVTLADFPDFVAGEQVLWASATQVGQLVIRDGNSGIRILHMTLAANVGQFQTIHLPPCMIRVDWANTSASSASISASMTKSIRS